MPDVRENRPVELDAAAWIADLLAQLTLEEKAALTVGRDAWTTHPVERLGIPVVWVSDGPTGRRNARTGSDTSLSQTSDPSGCRYTFAGYGRRRISEGRRYERSERDP